MDGSFLNLDYSMGILSLSSQYHDVVVSQLVWCLSSRFEYEKSSIVLVGYYLLSAAFLITPTVDKPSFKGKILAMPKWRNWQTRYVQGVVGFGPCGFDSHLRHKNNPERGCFYIGQEKVGEEAFSNR